MNHQTPREMTVEAALKQVADHLNNARARSAVHIAEQIIQQRPDHPHAHHLLGVAAYQLGDWDKMRSHLERSLSLQPENAGYLVNAAEMFRQNKDVDRAIQYGQRGVALDVTSAVAHANLGLAYYDSGDLERAEACQSKAIFIDPRHPNALNNLGSIARDRGDRDLALDFYRRACAADERYVEAQTNLASVLIEDDQRDEAFRILKRAIRRAPRHAEAHRALSHYYLLVPDLDEAERSARSALAITSGDVHGHILLAQVLLAKNRADLAKIEAEHALACAPEDHVAYHQLALCLADLGDADQARLHYEEALTLKSDYEPTLLALGYLELEFGNRERASAYFEQAEAGDPTAIASKIALARITEIDRPDHPLLAAMEAEAKMAERYPPERAASLFYALGSAYDGLNDKRAFPSFKRGADLKRQTLAYDADAYDARIDALIAAMSQEKINEMKLGRVLSDTPILVVGMPRSGTTLTESILAAHSMVDGAGELPFLQRFFGADDPEGPDAFLSFTSETLKEQASNYVAELGARGSGASRICDKMPANFHLVGLIHAVLPHAKIIHVQRDPRDTCLSMFTRLFEKSQLMSYDLRELGRAYKAYERLMRHWRCVLPEGAMHEVRYEDITSDFEAEAQRMLKYCGLDWEDSVMDFHMSKRRVRTASVTQVRQKLYSSSVGRWKRYSNDLQPLLRELERV